MKLILAWNLKAYKQFEDAIAFIKRDSLVNAEKFEIEILKKLNELLLQPERYHQDKFKIKNDGSYRAFEVFKYRISYQYSVNQIRIIRLRHTKMSPLKY